ncbi:hypothetical protein ACFTUP_10940 [Streptomyces niveus]
MAATLTGLGWTALTVVSTAPVLHQVPPESTKDRLLRGPAR